MQHSVCVLPDADGRTVIERFRAAEEAGFGTCWTYDHLSWRSLRDGPWLGALPVLAAAAAVTARLRLGPLVASPNFRHPVPFAKELMTLDQLCAGRLDVGLGAGGTGADATVLGEPPPTPAERGARFASFVRLLDQLLRQDATTAEDGSFAAADARMLPGCVQRPRVPLTIAAAGPRALRLAARHADTWVTYGPVAPVLDLRSWIAGIAAQIRVIEDAGQELGRRPRRAVLVSLDFAAAQDTVGHYRDTVAALTDLGVDELILHAPRPADPALPGPAPAVWSAVRDQLAAP